jgi:hypothetical protein
MNKKIWVGLLAGLLAVGTAAQTTKDGERMLRDALVKKQVFLRGFSDDKIVRWQWNGTALVQQEPKLHTFAVLAVESVKVKGTRVEIQGKRQTLLRTDETSYGLSSSSDKVQVEVELKRADMTGILPGLANLIFYPDVQTALAGTTLKPAFVDPTCCKRPPVDLKRCDCASASVAACRKDTPSAGMMGVTPPRVLSSVEPQFSQEARGVKFSGYVRIYLKIDEQGMPYDLWVMKPVGMDLDFNAGDAVRQYRFAPAACHGQPVPVDMYIDVNFQVF